MPTHGPVTGPRVLAALLLMSAACGSPQPKYEPSPAAQDWKRQDEERARQQRAAEAKPAAETALVHTAVPATPEAPPIAFVLVEDVEVRIPAARVCKVNVFKKIVDERATSKSDLLRLTVEIHQPSAVRKIDYQPWAETARLRDNFANAYKLDLPREGDSRPPRVRAAGGARGVARTAAARGERRHGDRPAHHLPRVERDSSGRPVRALGYVRVRTDLPGPLR